MEDILKERLALLKIDYIKSLFLGSKTSPEEIEILKRTLGVSFNF